MAELYSTAAYHEQRGSPSRHEMLEITCGGWRHADKIDVRAAAFFLSVDDGGLRGLQEPIGSWPGTGVRKAASWGNVLRIPSSAHACVDTGTGKADCP
eukprot:jgi/Botrbrau1/20431/Bobra.0607s0001.1